MGVDWVTPGYIVRDEPKRDKIRIDTGRGVLRYDEKVRVEKSKIFVRECWKEGRREEKRGNNTKWSKERADYIRSCGYAGQEAERLSDEGVEIVKD